MRSDVPEEDEKKIKDMVLEAMDKFTIEKVIIFLLANLTFVVILIICRLPLQGFGLIREEKV